MTAGLRVDVPKFGNTGFDNPVADALTFRDEDGSPVQYNSGALPDTTPSGRRGSASTGTSTGDQRTQVRGGTGVFTGKPPYVWISNQIGNTGVLTGSLQTDNTTAFPFNPNPDTYKPAADRRRRRELRARRHRPGLPVPADVAHQHRRRPQAAVGHRSARLDYIYNRD